MILEQLIKLTHNSLADATAKRTADRKRTSWKRINKVRRLL